MNGHKILIVDDEPSMVEAVEAVLKDKSYNVVSASDGEEGLRKVLEEKPDLIILDVIMPEKHGFQVRRELRTDPKYKAFSRIPVLMLTVYPDDREKLSIPMREEMTAEADGYIQKPFDPDELIERIEGLLRVSAGLR